MQKSLTPQGEVVDTLAIESTVAETKNSMLVNDGRVKVMRLVLVAGKSLPEHEAPGEMTVHCLSGEIQFTTMGKTQELVSGSLLYLPAGELHSLEAMEDSIVLLTILG